MGKAAEMCSEQNPLLSLEGSLARALRAVSCSPDFPAWVCGVAGRSLPAGLGKLLRAAAPGSLPLCGWTPASGGAYGFL